MPLEPAVCINPEVLEVTQLILSGQYSLAQTKFEALWQSLPDDDAFHRCILAHYIADVQADPSDELRWDLQALNTALGASPASFDGRIPDVTYASFLPSLHLNAAASFERVAQLSEAKQQAALAAASAAALGASPLADMTRSAIIRLCAKLGVEPRVGSETRL